MTRTTTRKNRAFSISMVLALLLMAFFGDSTAPYLSVTAYAAEKTAQTATEAAKPSIFSGFTLTVLDQKTPATYTQGKVDDRSTMCFMSADGKVVGTISYSDYNAIIKKYQKVVKLPGGGTYGAPPVDGKSWEAWFAEEYNTHRSISVDSQVVATSKNKADIIEEYRQEVIRLTNVERENAGLAPLEVNEDAMAFAQIRAEEVVTNYSHTRPNGGLLRVNDEIVNENVGARSTPERQVKSWMNSEGHRGNILNPEAYAIGVGVYQTDSGSLYWVQIFMW